MRTADKIGRHVRLLLFVLCLALPSRASAVGATSVWTRIWGSSFYEAGKGCAVDPYGDVYVCGVAWMSFDGQTNAGCQDIFLTKHDANGTKQWTRMWGSSGSEEPCACSCDPSGNVYVTGWAGTPFDGETNSGIFLTKHDPDGTRLWTRIWGGDTGYGCSCDASGNVYVVGGTQGSFDGQTNAGATDFYLTKYDTDGNKQWTRIWGSGEFPSICDKDSGRDCAVGGLGNVYVVGDTTAWSLDGQTNTNPGNWDLYLTRLSPDGDRDVQWTRLWGSTGDETAKGCAVDSFGNVYVAGETDSSFDGQTNAGGVDFCLTKFDADGRKQWTRIWGSATGECCYDCAADALGGVYVVGTTEGSFHGQTNSGDSDLCLTKYLPDGTWQWTRIWGSTSGDYGFGCAVAASGTVYATGYTYGSFDGQTNAGPMDICLTKWLDADADGDGMDDTWEVERFGDTATADAASDYDGDGLKDVLEFEHGTNPKSSDTDSDGMPDGWEVIHALDPCADDAQLDSDSDGMPNGKEFLAGTDPTNIGSCLKVVGFGRDNERCSITWKTVYGKGYWVQRAADLASDIWTNLWPLPIYELDETPEGSESLLDLNTLTNVSVFYRVLLE